MTRRRLHTLLQWAITIPAFVAAGYCVLFQRRFLPFITIWGVYLVAWMLLHLLMRYRVPRDQRIRPDAPPEIAALKVGLGGEHLARVVQPMRLAESRTVRPLLLMKAQRHDLYEASEEFPNGTWMWRVETAHDKLVAYAVTYTSRESPALDTGWGRIEGRSEFLDTSM
jgi:hypothetical protein